MKHTLSAEYESARSAVFDEFRKHDFSPEGEKRFYDAMDHLEAVYKRMTAAPDPLPEPPADPEDTPILPMGAFDPERGIFLDFGGGGDPLGWMTHFRPDPAKVRADYQAGYLLMRRMVGDGWTKQDVIRFVHKFFSPSAAFIAGCESYVYRNYRDYVRYFNEYHWQNDVARVEFENRPMRPIIDRIPF